MRRALLAFLLILAVLLSGCLGGSNTPTSTTPTTGSSSRPMTSSPSSSSTTTPPGEEKAPLKFLYPESPKVVNWSYDRGYDFFASEYSKVPYSQYGNITVNYSYGVFYGRYEFVLTNFTSGTLYLAALTTPNNPLALNITIEGVPLNLSRVDRYHVAIPDEEGVGIDFYAVNVSTNLTTLRGVAEYELRYMENERYILSLTSRDIGFGTDFSWWEFASRNASIRVIPEFPKDTVFVLFYGGIIRSGMEVTYTSPLKPHGGLTLYLQNMEWKGFEWGGINFTVYFTPDIYSDDGFELIKKELIFAMDLYRNMTGVIPTKKFDAMFYPGFSQVIAKRLGTKGFAMNFGHAIIINCPADMEDSATNYASFIFHEVAHEWAGPYISLDLNVHRLVEPLATFMQMEAYGKWNPDDYLRWLNDKEYTTLRYGNMRTFYDSLGPINKYTVYVLYYRGAFTLRSLRFVLGEDNFSRVFRGIFERFHTTQCKNITMFEDTIEELSGKNLDWFFSEWFNSTLYPDYNVTGLSLTGGAGGYNLTFTVTDASNFTMPVPVRIYLEDGDFRDYRVWVNGTARVSIELPEKPVKIVIDPEEVMANVNREFETNGIKVKVN